VQNKTQGLHFRLASKSKSWPGPWPSGLGFKAKIVASSGLKAIVLASHGLDTKLLASALA